MGLRAFVEVLNLLKSFGGIIDISRYSSITKKTKKTSCGILVSPRPRRRPLVGGPSFSLLGCPRYVPVWVAKYCSFLSYLSWLSAGLLLRALSFLQLGSFLSYLGFRGGGRRKSLLFSLLSWLSTAEVEEEHLLLHCKFWCDDCSRRGLQKPSSSSSSSSSSSFSSSCS